MKLLIPAFLLLLVASGCKKESSENNVSGLPDTSSVGRNFLACRVNGKVQLYSGKSSIMNASGVSFGFFVDHLGVSGSIGAYNDGLIMSVSTDSTIVTRKQYNFSDEANNRALYINYNPYDNPQYLTSSGSGWIRFSRLDTAVAAGTFAFTAHLGGTPGADSVVITDGRFDISAK